MELESKYAADPDFCELQSLRTRNYYSGQRAEVKRQLGQIMTKTDVSPLEKSKLWYSP